MPVKKRPTLGARPAPRKTSARTLPPRVTPVARPLLQRQPETLVPQQAAERQTLPLREALPQRPTQPNLPPRRRRLLPRGVGTYIGATVLSIGVMGTGLWYAFTDHKTAEQKKAEYVQGIVESISKLVFIPQGETPTIGIIPDPSAITDNKEFFKNASQGDYLVVFPSAHLMLIYSPSKNLVVNMGYATDATETQPEKAEEKKP